MRLRLVTAALAAALVAVPTAASSDAALHADGGAYLDMPGPDDRLTLEGVDDLSEVAALRRAAGGTRLVAALVQDDAPARRDVHLLELRAQRTGSRGVSFTVRPLRERSTAAGLGPVRRLADPGRPPARFAGATLLVAPRDTPPASVLVTITATASVSGPFVFQPSPGQAVVSGNFVNPLGSATWSATAVQVDPPAGLAVVTRGLLDVTGAQAAVTGTAQAPAGAVTTMQVLGAGRVGPVVTLPAGGSGPVSVPLP